ncbi:WcaG Nucleoside-diphosphate-sugar epimerases [uncultured Caudovirales phage]|uniref:WcaG Nucleoside-diphosphate-sugar epimerases n=1 Tax=uncultured Caudovirales phage TaxID=2100421 RepID=A0A6J5KWE8_9CAUD|nr:WcaG Nucleoside-diphosphate-sugar epimerases [uncultured Caudovirales phage]
MLGLTVYGGTGFIGSRYMEKYKRNFMAIRGNNEPLTDDILYLISTTDNYNVLTNPHLDIDTNLTVLIDVLEAWRNKNPKGVFNFISSWFVYGDTELPAKETSYCNPKGFYSITKRAAEQLIISYCETFGLKYRILRLGNVVGKGDSKVSAKKNALQYLINRLKNNEPIELYDDGDFFRDYIHIEDCTSAINLVVNSTDYNQIYNIGNGKKIHFREIIDLAYAKLESKSEVTSIPQKEFHKIVQVKSMYMDDTKIKNLGYVQKYQIEDIVDNLIA